MAKNKPWYCEECRIMMAAIDEDHCKCPICGTEVWYKYDAPDLSEQHISADKTHYVSRSLPERYRVPPGGCRAGKVAKKKGTKIYIENGFDS